jgi:hypothetical protein
VTRKKDDDEVKVWIEQEAIHIKVITSYGDPVEMTAEEARRLARELIDYAAQIDR